MFKISPSYRCPSVNKPFKNPFGSTFRVGSGIAALFFSEYFVMKENQKLIRTEKWKWEGLLGVKLDEPDEKKESELDRKNILPLKPVEKKESRPEWQDLAMTAIASLAIGFYGAMYVGKISQVK